MYIALFAVGALLVGFVVDAILTRRRNSRNNLAFLEGYEHGVNGGLYEDVPSKKMNEDETFEWSTGLYRGIRKRLALQHEQEIKGS